MKVTFEVDNQTTHIFDKPDYLAVKHFASQYGEQILTMSSRDCEKVLKILKDHYKNTAPLTVPKQGENDV